MMKIILYLLYLFPLIAFSQQQDRLSIFTGPIIPIGKELTHTYSFGARIGVECKILSVKKFKLSSDLSADVFVNNPQSQSKISDNLFLYPLQLKASYLPTQLKGWIEPSLGVGYMVGVNFIADKSSDFTGGYFHSKIRVMNLDGLIISGGLMSKEINRIKLGIVYRLQRPNANLTDNIKSSFPYSYNTQLYGPTVKFESQKMNLNNLSLFVSIRL